MSTTPTEDAPQPAWGASPSGVRDLVLDTAAEGRIVGQRAPRVDDDRVRAWLASAANIVAVQTGLADRLPPEAAPGWALDAPRVDAVRRHLCELYAAALLADVTHPTLARENRSPGQPLKERFDAELAALVAAIGTALDRGPDVDPDTPGTQTDAGAAFTFPPSPRLRSRRF